MFYALAAILVGAGFVLALYVQLPFSAGAWFTGVILVVFAFIGRQVVSTELTGPVPASAS